MEKLLNTNDMLNYLGIGKTKLYEMINNGYLPTTKIGNRYYISETKLNNFIIASTGKQYK